MCMNTELKLHKKTFAELTLDELYELLNLRYLYARRHSAHKNEVENVEYFNFILLDKNLNNYGKKRRRKKIV